MELKDAHELIERLKIATSSPTDIELSRKLGLSKQSIASARKTGKVPDSWMPKVSEEFKVSLDWLRWGIGSMQLASHIGVGLGTLIPGGIAGCVIGAAAGRALGALKSKLSDTQPSNQDSDTPRLVYVPIVKSKLSEKGGELQSCENKNNNYVFNADFLQLKGSVEDMVLMPVEGDSMSPEIIDGDMALIDQSKKEIRLGRLFAVGFGEAIYLRRIDIFPGKIILKSVNPDYKPLEFDSKEETHDLFKIIGQVIWIGRDYK